MAVIRDELSRNGIDVIGYGVANSAAIDVAAEDIWRPEGMRKRLDNSRVYEHARRLGVDGAVVIWYEASMDWCSRKIIEAYLFDVRLRKVYRETGEERRVARLTDTLMKQFHSERSSAGVTQ
jgi:hypothetical protein